MKSTKKTKKEPKFIVDYTDIQLPQQVYAEYILAKTRAGMTITESEADALINYGVFIALDEIDNCLAHYNTKCTVIQDDKLADKLLDITLDYIKKKNRKPWYKRFWNWITRKKQ